MHGMQMKAGSGYTTADFHPVPGCGVMAEEEVKVVQLLKTQMRKRPVCQADSVIP